jgi:hypothetical protein
LPIGPKLVLTRWQYQSRKLWIIHFILVLHQPCMYFTIFLYCLYSVLLLFSWLYLSVTDSARKYQRLE